jgi:CRISPR-associated protein Csm2
MLDVKKDWKIEDFKSDWIKNGFSDETIEFASGFGEELTKGGERMKLTTSQIRNVFGEIKRIQMRVSDDSQK